MLRIKTPGSKLSDDYTYCMYVLCIVHNVQTYNYMDLCMYRVYIRAELV